MITAIAFLVAAGVGALARAEAGRRWNAHEGMAWGMLGVNVLGSFVLGFLHQAGQPVITVVGVGGLGAFTTFSSFARDTVALAHARKITMCALYVGATLSAGVGAAAVGVALA